MKHEHSSLEERMRRLEWFHGLTIPENMWFIVRVDGRSFTTHAKKQGLERPFDMRFHNQMLATTRALMSSFNGLCAYTESDEISILFKPEWNEFHRSVEKIVSLSAATASVEYTMASSVPATFDSRIWIGAQPENVLDYFVWRAKDAVRCGINTWAYWTLRNQENLSARAATQKLERATILDKKNILLSHNIVYEETPLWQQYGTLVLWEFFEKHSVNGLTGEPVVAQRRHLVEKENFSTELDFEKFISKIVL